jgi:hypothetical protein
MKKPSLFDSLRWSKMSEHMGAATEPQISSWHIQDPMADLSFKTKYSCFFNAGEGATIDKWRRQPGLLACSIKKRAE